MAATNVLHTQRSHKVSTTSNTTQLTDITLAESNSSCEDQVFQQPMLLRSVSRKRRISSALVRMETLPEHEFHKDEQNKVKRNIKSLSILTQEKVEKRILLSLLFW